ncbi:MAG TPA: prephenate dehydrogenase/arogenate dehydrogenase family protein, partial [Elusimicrobia bacterium]|nr:prephenate dehydrogenase/arogenate dehydrogenase family protein [Elusimicrobiota bacterium]
MKNKLLEKIKTVAITGVGLIGGSIGLAIKAVEGVRCKVTGIGRNKNKLIKAKKLGAIDDYTTDFKEGVKEADLVIIATPVGTIASIIEKILPHLKPGAIITDVGSVKAPIVSAIESFLSHSPFPTHHLPVFIGGHPLAGSEKSGIDYARADLFRGAICFLTPTKKTPLKVTETIQKFWELLGAKVLILSPQIHDCLLARSSHLPHLLAAGLVNLIAQNKNKYSSQVLGPSFRDLTRIASSEPQIWTDISFSNRKEIITALG